VTNSLNILFCYSQHYRYSFISHDHRNSLIWSACCHRAERSFCKITTFWKQWSRHHWRMPLHPGTGASGGSKRGPGWAMAPQFCA